MRFICPKCDGKFDGSQNRYDIWQCPSCLGKFRGIHCDVDMVDYNFSALFPLSPKFWYTAIFDSSYDVGGINKSFCPFCNAEINGRNGDSKNGWWPTVCRSCSSHLPTDHIEDEPIVEPEPKHEEPRPDYKKLMDLINKL